MSMPELKGFKRSPSLDTFRASPSPPFHSGIGQSIDSIIDSPLSIQVDVPDILLVADLL